MNKAVTEPGDSAIHGIGRRLKEFGKSIYGSNKKLAAACGIVPDAIGNYTSGRRLPGSEMLLKFLRAGVNANWLLTGKGEMLAKDMISTAEVEDLQKEVILLREENKTLKAENYDLKQKGSGMNQKIKDGRKSININDTGKNVNIKK